MSTLDRGIRESIGRHERVLNVRDRRSVVERSGTRPGPKEASCELPLNEGGTSADHQGVDLNRLLRNVVEIGASDLHLKVAQPPIVRRDGMLRLLEGWPELGSGDLEHVVRPIGASDPARLAAFRAIRRARYRVTRSPGYRASA